MMLERAVQEDCTLTDDVGCWGDLDPRPRQEIFTLRGDFLG